MSHNDVYKNVYHFLYKYIFIYVQIFPYHSSTYIQSDMCVPTDRRDIYRKVLVDTLILATAQAAARVLFSICNESQTLIKMYIRDIFMYLYFVLYTIIDSFLYSI